MRTEMIGIMGHCIIATTTTASATALMLLLVMIQRETYHGHFFSVLELRKPVEFELPQTEACRTFGQQYTQVL